MSDFFPLPYNVTNFQELMVYNNTITHDLFGVGILFTIFSIAFITMLPFGNKQSFVASVWLTSVISVFMWILQLVNPEIMVALAVITALGTIFLFRTREN